MIELDSLTVSLGSFTLGPLGGTFGARSLAIVGEAQSGKTTLLKALCGLNEASSGTVVVDGQRLTGASNLERSAIRAKFGMVFQNDALFDSLDALNNVGLPLLRRGIPRDEARERAREALAQVGLAGQERTLPERLSGGMRKRLGLARAIVARPAYLLADDLLAGLDPATSHRVLELVFGLWAGRGGLIVAAADPSPFWSRCEEVLVLGHGKVLCRGPANDVRHEPRVEALFGGEDAA
ncbi:MAG: ATP-binding cassette domain-containing protein [Myxococcales bacterium]